MIYPLRKQTPVFFSLPLHPLRTRARPYPALLPLNPQHQQQSSGIFAAEWRWGGRIESSCILRRPMRDACLLVARADRPAKKKKEKKKYSVVLPGRRKGDRNDKMTARLICLNKLGTWPQSGALRGVLFQIPHLIADYHHKVSPENELLLPHHQGQTWPFSFNLTHFEQCPLLELTSA